MPLTQTSSTKLFRASGKCYDENVKKIKASENKLEQNKLMQTKFTKNNHLKYFTQNLV